MRNIALFAFNGDPMCFIHVLLNALDMKEKGDDVKIIFEGAATKLVPELVKKDHPLSSLYQKAKALNLIDGVCKACSNKMGTLEAVKTEGLKFLDEMTGHPSISRYRQEGFEIIIF